MTWWEENAAPAETTLGAVSRYDPTYQGNRGTTDPTSSPYGSISGGPNVDFMRQFNLQYGRWPTDAEIQQWQASQRGQPQLTTQQPYNPYGAPSAPPNSQYTDPRYITEQINLGFQQAYGRPPSQEEFDYWMKKATTPDVYSDNRVRVGWNPYLMARLTNPGSASADVNLAGMETVIGQAPPGGGSYYAAPMSARVDYGGGQYPLSAVSGEGFMRPWTTAFQAPNDVTQQNDPGWEFRMKEGLKAIERSAASKGTLLTGGTLKDLNSWAQDYASGEYDKVYGRALDQYKMAYGIYNDNLSNQWNRMGWLSNSGQQAAQDMSRAGTGYADAMSRLYTGQGDALGAGQAASGNIWGDVITGVGGAAGGIIANWPKSGSTPSTPGAPYMDPIYYR